MVAFVRNSAFVAILLYALTIPNMFSVLHVFEACSVPVSLCCCDYCYEDFWKKF